MAIKIAVVEDEDEVATILIEYINRFGSENGEIFSIQRFSDGDEILDGYKPLFDVIFFDIHMKRFDGMNAAKEIRKLDEDVSIIFVTNLQQYAIEGYSVRALDFLLKPVAYPVFEQLLTKLVNKIKEAKKKEHILLPAKNGLQKLNVNGIYYIECFSHKIIVHTETEAYSLTGTLNQFEEKLDKYSFYRCGRSHILNLAYVKALAGREVTIGAYKIFISKPQRKELLEAIMAYQAKNMYDSGN